MRRFEKKDLATLNEWLAGHECPPLSVEAIPLTGLLMENVAAGFLYQTDSCIAFLENFVSNPSATPRQVSDAVDEITQALLDYAGEIGIKNIVVLTRLGSIEKRAEKFGLKKNPNAYTRLSLEVH